MLQHIRVGQYSMQDPGQDSVKIGKDSSFRGWVAWIGPGYLSMQVERSFGTLLDIGDDLLAQV